MNRLHHIALLASVCCFAGSATAAPDCIHPLMTAGDLELEAAIVNGNGPFDADSSNASITTGGALTAGGTPPALTLPAYPRNRAKNDTEAAVVPAGSFDKVTVENTTTFTGGTYYIRSLEVEKDAIAILAPGDYFIERLTLRDRAALIVSPAGPVRIYVDNKIDLKKDVSMNDGGAAGNLQVYLYDDAEFQAKERTTFTGLIYSDSPDSEIDLEGPNEINGAIVTAGEVKSEDGLTLNLDDSVLAAFGLDIKICVEGFDHFEINHDGFGINCQAESIAVTVADVLGNPVSGYTGVIILDTGTGTGSWVATTGAGTLVDAIADDGLAAYAFIGSETQPVSFSLEYPNGPAVLNIDVYDQLTPTLRDDDTEGAMQFGPSGFVLTAAPLTNPPPVVVTPFSVPQTAGTDFPVYIAAYGQTPGDPVCGIIETYAGAKALKFWMSYADPGSGTRAVNVDTNPLGSAEAAAAPLPVTFTNGQAGVTSKYKDVGRIQIMVKDDSSADPDLPNGIRGATANFVVKPHHFELTGIEDNAGNPNPAAADATGPGFIAAGDPFTATVTVFDAEGDITPNYGQESSAETVRLNSLLLDPVAGSNPAVTAAVGFGPFINGQATGNDFVWPEVGIISLRPSVGDGNYFDAGDVAGFDSGNVGRFIPHHFTASLNDPSFTTACASGTFTYIGESFGYSTAPVITVTAREAGGATTQNYAGDFFKLTNTSLANRTYSAATGSLNISGLPLPSADPAIASLGSGLGTLTFSAGSGLAFERTAPQAAFAAAIQLSIDVLDADGVMALSNPVTFGNPGGISFDNGAEQRYGRIRLNNALGSELVNLAVPMRAEYFLDAATGFVANTLDSCTNAVTLSFSLYTEALAPGETCVLDTGSPGGSGAGCGAPGPFALQFREPPLGGDFNLNLGAPGAGNNGSVKVTADVPDWLTFDWAAASPGNENPEGTATFGIFDGENRRIYIREIY